MAAMTDYLEDKIRGHVLQNTAYTSPTTVYAALFSDATDDTGGGTEATGGSYARQSVAFSSGASGTDAAESSADVTFSNMPADTWTHLALFDAASSCNMLLHGPLSASKTTASGDDLVIEAGDIDVVFG